MWLVIAKRHAVMHGKGQFLKCVHCKNIWSTSQLDLTTADTINNDRSDALVPRFQPFSIAVGSSNENTSRCQRCETKPSSTFSLCWSECMWCAKSQNSKQELCHTQHITTYEADGWRWLTCLHLPVYSQAKLVAGLGILAAQGL